MIDYVIIKNTARTTIGIIDTANSIIWHSVYYGVGDFEIYVRATPQYVNMLQTGYYVLRQDTSDVGVIEHIELSFDLQNGYMITASGRFAKSILDRRLIYKLSGTVNTPTILSGKVEVAVRQVVTNNAISCSFDSRRNIQILGLAALKGYTATIVDENGNSAQKQVSYQNLMEYTDEVLQEYGMAARVIYNDSNKKLLYEVYQGNDRSSDNTAGNEPIVFSVDYDNLNSSDYSYDETPLKNSVLIGGAGEDLERFYTLLTKNKSGLQLREIFLDASSINRTYRNEGDTQDKTYTNAEYRAMLNQQGNITLKEQIVAETFNGDVNVTFGRWILYRDYFLGDIVTVQDNKINKYIDTRIVEITEVQDENGYKVDVVFGE